jgi:hypothetical protein
MTTFTTEDRELVELQIKTFQSQQCLLTHPSCHPQKYTSPKPQALAQYRIEDTSEDLDDWPS